MSGLWEPKYKSKNKYPLPKKNTYNKSNRLFLQTIITILIFLSIWFIFKMNGPLWFSIQGSIRTWFTEDADASVLIKAVEKIGMYDDSFDRATYEVISPFDNKPIEPMAIPVSGTVTVPYGWVKSNGHPHFHEGLVIKTPAGTAIKAAYAGTVLDIKEDGQYKRTLVISHPNGLVTVYGYCSEILVRKDQKVEKGQIIAKVGKVKDKEEAYLYFEANRLGEPVNPLDLLEKEKNI